ncbi:hypothetical protein CONCODRAFT_78539 [Conidiobolus coronatus NRRL 28638]|uniref:Guanosine-3',5'-bis(diphosphate) 3'-pyrophosphohydrolase MESH1 n=1 Tax=Conidiobolus coronatus (strain ATCC 28846 / CBS 209.66 / NRRL 28638) TaxID=796925 RepID=A0A137P7S9_CONC2|nr:hypothetical protein CONCODRAFT_78539 [Conidiobolus coronatus NRRL 28638]|eukprot:KXN71060.1 hypothetical protein CONCODRAFT_78539 [Conidiobolus coronatus NRRL 28638]
MTLNNDSHLDLNLPPQQTLILFETLKFSSEKHRFQKRKDILNTPYINHPIAVAKHLLEGGISYLPLLQAAVLHDTVEDTDTTFEEIELLFGPEVRLLVSEVTDDFNLPKHVRKRLQVETAKNKSLHARQLKLADKLNNLKDIMLSPPVGWTVERVKEYFRWALEVVNECRGVNEYLENQLDLIFKEGTFIHEGKTYKCIE